MGDPPTSEPSMNSNKINTNNLNIATKVFSHSEGPLDTK